MVSAGWHGKHPRSDLTGLYPDSPVPSIARQRYSPAFYKPVTFIAFLNPISENTDSSTGFLYALCGERF
jgi:hypothetical protein